MTARIGDVVAACAGNTAVIASRAEPRESALVGMHGSLTPAEQLVPLLAFPAQLSAGVRGGGVSAARASPALSGPQGRPC
jgi:hypothetical protein